MTVTVAAVTVAKLLLLFELKEAFLPGLITCTVFSRFID